MSPNYGRYGGPENYYQGGGDGSFDPYSGRLNMGQLIQQFILRKYCLKLPACGTAN